MPSYSFEVATADGVERYPFTLDDDRVLGPQVIQVLEELRLRGIVLHGTQTDVLAVYWEGRELDQEKPPCDLGISAARPILLRMKDAALVVDAVDHSLPRGVLASVVFGYGGALLAWGICGFWTDTTTLMPNYARLDLLTMMLLTAFVGGAIMGGSALRGRTIVVIAVLAGLLLGILAGGIGASVTLMLPPPTSTKGFLVARLLGWSITGLLIATSLAVTAQPRTPRRLLESAVLGALGGMISSALFALPGPTGLWQGIAFLAFGGAIAVAVSGPLLWSAVAIVEEVPASGGLPGVFSLREWPLHDSGSVALGDALVACQENRLALYPPANGATLNRRDVRVPTYLSGSAWITIGGARYRLRVAGSAP